jgi:hypothetical protein
LAARFPVLNKTIFKLLPTKRSMLDNEKLELAGPVGVIAALACAEVGAHALAYWPSSMLLWYVDIEMFRPLQYSFATTSEPTFGDLGRTLCMAAPLVMLISIGLITGRRLPLALASNLSFVFSAALLYGSYLADRPLAGIHNNLGALCVPSVFLALSILFVAFLSSIISHRAYWRKILS